MLAFSEFVAVSSADTVFKDEMSFESKKEKGHTVAKRSQLTWTRFDEFDQTTELLQEQLFLQKYACIVSRNFGRVFLGNASVLLMRTRNWT